MEWLNKYAPGFMCVGSKPLERHTICWGLTYIWWRAQIVEDKHRPRPLGQELIQQVGEKVKFNVKNV